MKTPLLQNLSEDGQLFFHEGQWIRPAEFLHTAQRQAEQMAETQYVLNLCDNRLHFSLGLAAALLRGQTTLMPPNRAPEALTELITDYPNSQILWDQPLAGLNEPPIPASRIAFMPRNGSAAIDIPEIDEDQPAVIAFTSGSTGKPKANIKTWAMLRKGTEMAARRFFDCQGNRHIVATVPPQHMYGLETSVLYAMLAGCPTHTARPFFPADVAQALHELPDNRVLVTTPAHLRALIKSDISLPTITFIISATAPLPLALAKQAEDRYDTAVREIYGCTEAGSLASRQQTQNSDWQLYDGMQLSPIDNNFLLSGPQLPEPVPLQDRIEPQADYHFRLLGRNEDMLNIAGKRASLTDLTEQLLSIDGVQDAVMIAPDDTEDARVGRLAALVVAPEQSIEDILLALKPKIDAAFLPRPIIKVDKLPRTSASKLPRAAVLAILNRELSTQKPMSSESSQ